MLTTLSSRTETRLARAGFGVLALRVFDDTVLQPPAGVPVTERPLAALLPLAALALLAWAYSRLRGAARAALTILVGVLGIASGVDAVYYTQELGLRSQDVTGWLALPASVGLIGLAGATLWRTRRRTGRYLARRTALGAGGLVALAFGVMPFAVGYVKTHTARAVVPADRLGIPHETVSFESSDGLTLHGWYVPSRNGKAIIAFPGRSGPQDQARMLARHGYGVLLFDRRGEGRSDGQPNAMGWGGESDIKGAIAFLEARGIDRIGGIGLSVGGELMLEAATKTTKLDAVVSEGAGARTMAETFDLPGRPTHDRWLGAVQYALHDLGIFVSTGDTPPEHLGSLVEKIEQPTLLIAAPNTRNGEKLNRVYAEGSEAQLWEIPESKHIQAIKARPAEYERRVVGFFDEAL
ncbi:alpha/beta fold hydrolase [Solirubrobacter taibaiensis]|nr:alpha/beta fold hydrolase [Solirubrobacter taibaiensis]